MKPDYIEIAEKELNVKEIPGKASNHRVLEYHAATELAATDDAVPWCSAFVNWVLKQARYRRSHSAAARSWLSVGEPIKKFEQYCIVILSRGKSPWQGHVGFGIEVNEDKIKVLGGNQGDKVCYAEYPISRVLGYRRPIKLA